MLQMLFRILILAFGTSAYSETCGAMLGWPDWKTSIVQDLIYYPGALILWSWIMEGWKNDT